MNRSKGNRLFVVAQIFNLLYRRIVFCLPSKTARPMAPLDTLPIANRRYRRLKVYATGTSAISKRPGAIKHLAAIAAKEFGDRFRSGWVITCMLLWLGAVGLASLFGLLQIGRIGLQGYERTVVSLLNLVQYLVPLLGLDGAQATYALGRVQRGLVALTCFIFFGLTVNSDMGSGSTGEHIQWVFLFVGLGMLWRCLFTHDEPEKPHTATMIYFQLLIIALGLLLFLTPVPMAGRVLR